MPHFLRVILAIIAGYVSMAACLMAVFTGAYLILGAELSFQYGSWEASMLWNLLSVVVGLGAALCGGFVCSKVCSDSTAAWILIGLILVLGVVMAATYARPPESFEPRDFEPDNVEAMRLAISPGWINWLNPLLGAAGVALGSGLFARSDHSLTESE